MNIQCDVLNLISSNNKLINHVIYAITIFSSLRVIKCYKNVRGQDRIHRRSWGGGELRIPTLQC
jgi:hypothetical protein